MRTDFNLLDLFTLFDTTDKKFLSQLDLERGLNKLEVFPSFGELQVLMKRYDLNHDGTLVYNEFCDMLIPRSPEYAKLMEQRDSFNTAHSMYTQGKNAFSVET